MDHLHKGDAMGAAGEQLAIQFETANNQFISTVESMSDADWRRVTASEGWPAGVTAHHVAESMKAVSGLVSTTAKGGEMPPLSMEGLNASNAEHAARAANVTKAETVALIRANGRDAAAMLRGLSDEELARTNRLPALPEPVTARQMTEMVLIGHTQTHGASLKPQ